jgi:hypothetical protein
MSVSFLTGARLVTALSEADIASLGTAESFLTVSNLSKTRQAHQITACCLYDLIKKAYMSVSFLTGARCYKVSFYSFVADNMFFLSNDTSFICIHGYNLEC